MLILVQLKQQVLIMVHILSFIKKVRHQFYNFTNRNIIKIRNFFSLISFLSAAKGWSFCNSHNSLGYLRSTSNTHPLELLLLYLFESKPLGSIHLNPLVKEMQIFHNHMNSLCPSKYVLGHVLGHEISNTYC